MTIFKTLNIETTKNYNNTKDVRRHIGLTPRHAIAIDELKILYEAENGIQLTPSAIINFALELLIQTIEEQPKDQQVEFILDNVDKYQ